MMENEIYQIQYNRQNNKDLEEDLQKPGKRVLRTC